MNDLSAKDFTTDQEVRWCPGCGDYAILKAVRATLADIGRAPHEVVFVSGIGCAARFPYYIASYGFHTLHGRAPSVATGVKMANPDLDVWVVGGDGDMLAIGGNHLIHTLRRDTDLNILLFNNAIYGLTKGQFSPASPVGTKSPTSPQGTQDAPVDAALLALGAGARFVSRSADTMIGHLSATLKRAQAHKGAALVEIFQNCIIYFDGVWGGMASKANRQEQTIEVEHGQPLIFGAERDKGLAWNGDTATFELISGGDGSVEGRATVFDETNIAHATALARMNGEGFPVALGVLYCAEETAKADTTAQSEKLDVARLQKIVNGANSWQVGSD